MAVDILPLGEFEAAFKEIGFKHFSLIKQAEAAKNTGTNAPACMVSVVSAGAPEDVEGVVGVPVRVVFWVYDVTELDAASKVVRLSLVIPERWGGRAIQSKNIGMTTANRSLWGIQWEFLVCEEHVVPDQTVWLGYNPDGDPAPPYGSELPLDQYNQVFPPEGV